MVSPTTREKHVPSKDILTRAARRLQPTGVRNGDGDGGNNRQEKVYDVVSKIWSSVGLVIENSLISAARGVRIESVGTFTLDAKGCAGFFLAADFARRFRLLKYDMCSGGCLVGGAVNTRLNVAKVAATAGSPRPEAERVVDAVLRALQQRLATGSSVTLSFHPVAEFSCTPCGKATMRFLRSFRAKEKKAAVDATRIRVGVARTKSTPKPWGTTLAETVTSAICDGTAGPPITAKSKSTRRRPHSASSGSLHHSRTDHPETSQLPGNRKCLSIASASDHGSSTTHNAITSNIGRSTAKGARTGTALESPRRAGRNSPRRPKTASSSVSSRFSPSVPSTRHRGSAPGNGIGTSSRFSHNDDELQTIAQENTSLEKTGLGTVRHSSASRIASTTSNDRLDVDQENQESWLSGLLRRQTLAQAGCEGFQRLIETLRLTHITSENGGGGGGRLSGRDLLMALRDVGTKLTSAELADTTNVFRWQPDGCISLPVLLAEMTMGHGEAPRQQGVPSVKEGDIRTFPSAAGEKEVGSTSVLSIGGIPQRGSSGIPWESASCQAGSPLIPSPSASWAVSAKGASPCLSESSTVDKLLRRGKLGERARSRCGGHQQQRGGERKVHGGGREQDRSPRVSTEQATVPACSTAPQHARRECWGADEGNRGGPGAGLGSAVGGDAIADLARIVYNPPSSLEKLIHILQASKVNNA